MRTSTSSICSPMVSTGLRLDIGSWNTAPIAAPRSPPNPMRRAQRSCPAKRMLLAYWPGRQQPDQRQSEAALARAALSHQGDDLAGADGQCTRSTARTVRRQPKDRRSRAAPSQADAASRRQGIGDAVAD